MRDYRNRYCRVLLRSGLALLVLGVLDFVVTSRVAPAIVGGVVSIIGLTLRFRPVARVGVDQIELDRGLLRARVVVPFTAITGVDESHSKFVRLWTDEGDLRIPTGALTKEDRTSLVEDLRMGARQVRAGARGAGSAS